VTLSLERDNLSGGEDSNKVADKVESFSKKEKTLGEIEEVKMKVDLEKSNEHNDLATNHESGEMGRNTEQPITMSTNPKLQKTGRLRDFVFPFIDIIKHTAPSANSDFAFLLNRGLLHFFTSSAQCSSISSSVAVSERPSSFSSLGY